jgi:RES domain-containing protein
VDVWRITTPEYADRALSGEGAARYGGRWNPRGLAVVYASSSLSLAVLELLVQTGAQVVPTALRSVRIDIPESVSIRDLPPDGLPASWRDYPAPSSLQVIGSEWIETGSTAVLSVPSAVVPEEKNYLLNPGHPDSEKVSVQSISEMDLDLRLAALLRPNQQHRSS